MPQPRHHFKIKIIFPYLGIIYKDKTVMKPSYLYNKNPYTGKVISLYLKKILCYHLASIQPVLNFEIILQEGLKTVLSLWKFLYFFSICITMIMDFVMLCLIFILCACSCTCILFMFVEFLAYKQCNNKSESIPDIEKSTGPRSSTSENSGGLMKPLLCRSSCPVKKMP